MILPFRFLFAVCLAGAVIRAQSPSPTRLSGTVTDPTGAPVASAEVTLDRAGHRVAETLTGDDGGFTVTIQEGTYTFGATAPGFATFRRELVVGKMDDDIVVRLQLRVVRDAVTVRSGPSDAATSTATKTATALLDLPQSITVIPSNLAKDQLMTSIADAVRYAPGVTSIQGENNRDQVVIRGNSTSADFFVNGVRDDVQYYRDLYDVDRVEVLKGPNAMIFGRGGGGGIINRVTKEATPDPLMELDLQGGAFGDKRFAADFGRPLNSRAAFRLNGVYESSDSFRRFVGLERYGIAPALTLVPDARTRITLGYEFYRDGRTADRGLPSLDGLPAPLPASTYIGDPDNSRVRASVHLGSAAVERQAGRMNLHNTTMVGDYDRGYQNFVPGAITADQTSMMLSAYNNATQRRNFFNQTDISADLNTGNVRHTVLWGAEFGSQNSDNFRNTGYFGNASPSVLIPYLDITAIPPVVFRQSATDADNHVKANVAAGYVQDQVVLSRYVQLVGGIRVDRFGLGLDNHRTGRRLERVDLLVSPRAGIVIKPISTLSVYGNYSVSWLPSAGDQFASLTDITEQLRPEKFNSYEVGTKWDAGRKLSLTAAAYRLDRTNTRSVDPNDPTRILQTGSQRSNGVEVGVNGSVTRQWSVAGGYAWQDAFVTNATVSAATGAQVPQVPHHTFSLWNNYQIHSRLSAGLGVLNRSDMFAGIDNRVTLPGYVRADAALFYVLTERVRLQANVENLFDRDYYVNADGNNNISPGSPRAIRIGMIARF